MSFLIGRARFLPEEHWIGRDLSFPTPYSEEYTGSTTCFVRTGEERLFGAIGQPVPHHSSLSKKIAWTPPRLPDGAPPSLWRQVRTYAEQVLSISPTEKEKEMAEYPCLLPPEVIRVAAGDVEGLLAKFVAERTAESVQILGRSTVTEEFHNMVRRSDLEWMKARFHNQFGCRYDDFDLTRPVAIERDFAAALLYAESQSLWASEKLDDICLEIRDYLSYEGHKEAFDKKSVLIHTAWTAWQNGDTGAARIALITALSSGHFWPDGYRGFLLHIAQALPIAITRDNWVQQRDAILPVIGTDTRPGTKIFYQNVKDLTLSSPISEVLAVRRKLKGMDETGLSLLVFPLLDVLQYPQPGQGRKITEALVAVEKFAATLNDAADAQRICVAIRGAIEVHEIAQAQKQLTILMRRATKETACNLQDAITVLQDTLRGRSSRR